MKHLAISIACGILGTVCAQSYPVIISPIARLPQDSVLKQQLIQTLSGFLEEKEKPASENSYVLKEDLPETSALLDELKGIERSGRFNSASFYKCYLLNMVKLDSTLFSVQFSYMGTKDSMLLQRALFNVLVRRRMQRYYVTSPLKRNTGHWKQEKTGTSSVVYRGPFNAAKARPYFKTVERFDTKLGLVLRSNVFYACADYPEALQILGISYKSDYSGQSRGVLSSVEDGHALTVDGLLIADHYEFDPHDLWHSRLRRKIPSGSINRPVDEGIAYVYGGSWGISCDTILARFRSFAKAHPAADWVSVYNQSPVFSGGERTPLNADFAINALLVQKIEKEKGFAAVLELVSCGKKEEGNANYFKALQKITGITKETFNTEVEKLITGK